MRTNKLIIAAATVALGLSLASTATAQNSTTGAIAGIVKDKAGGDTLPGVTIVATSPALQGTQSAITEGEGSYKITNLPPGIYQVTYYYSDITVRRNNIQVTINRTTPVYVKLDTSQAGGEIIEINDRAPTIDPTSTTQGITLDQNYTRNIPIPGRTFESALGAAPGTAGDALGVSFSGSTSLENSYVVDGINTTGLTYGTVGSPLINDFIEEIEIITGGYQAEYGRATGGVVNVVTKSGSNEFHGSVFSYFRNSLLSAEADRAPSQSSSIDATGNLAYDFNFGFDLGGPIVKDKVWFYVGFAPRLIGTNIERITKRQTDCRVILADGTLSACDPAANGDGTPDEDLNGFLIYEDLDRTELSANTTEYQFVSKINFAASPEHQGQATFSGTPFSGETVGVRGEPGATSFDFVSLTTDVALKWTSKFNNNKTEIEGILGWHRSKQEADSIDNNLNDTPRQNLYFGNLGTWGLRGFESQATVNGCTDSAAAPANDPYPFIENCPDRGAGYRIGGPGGLLDDIQARYTARLSVTQRVKAAGNHEIKAGMDVEDNNLNRRRIISGGVYYDNLLDRSQVNSLRWVQLAAPSDTDPRFDNICGQDSDGMDRACDFLGPSNVTGETINWAAYLRDSWQVMPNLTLNVGMRYEEQRLRFAEELQGTVDPFTGNQLGKNAMVMKNMWAPRLGLLYDWTKEGRSKIYTSWGRFYESIPMDINDRSFGGEVLLRETFDSASQCGPRDDTIGGADASMCTGNPALGSQLFGSGVLVAPGVKAMYLDEIVVGVEYEVMEDLKFGVSVQNRRLGRVLEDVSVDNADTYILANPGEFDTGEERKLEAEIAAETDPNEIARLQSNLDQFRRIRIFDKPKREYNALQLTATRRFSRSIFVQASYTYSRTTGNFPGLFSADNGQVDPNITSQYDLIELLSNRQGNLPQDRPHYIKLDSYYVYEVPDNQGDFTTGIRYRALSGTPISALGRHYLYGFDESFLLPRGAMGRTRFDHSLDIHIGYAREIGKGMRVELFSDFFSVFNNQGTFSVDQTYTFAEANPVVGGEYEDLVFAKRQSTSGAETADPVTRNRNFQNTRQRYSPFAVRLGARLTF